MDLSPLAQGKLREDHQQQTKLAALSSRKVHGHGKVQKRHEALLLKVIPSAWQAKIG